MEWIMAIPSDDGKYILHIMQIRNHGQLVSHAKVEKGSIIIIDGDVSVLCIAHIKPWIAITCSQNKRVQTLMTSVNSNI